MNAHPPSRKGLRYFDPQPPFLSVPQLPPAGAAGFTGLSPPQHPPPI